MDLQQPSQAVRKSITANMLAAYYSRGCDSKQMFAGLSIAREESFAKHLNQYEVIHLTCSGAVWTREGRSM